MLVNSGSLLLLFWQVEIVIISHVRYEIVPLVGARCESVLRFCCLLLLLLIFLRIITAGLLLLITMLRPNLVEIVLASAANERFISTWRGKLTRSGLIVVVAAAAYGAHLS